MTIAYLNDDVVVGSEVRADKVSYASEQYGERGDVAG